MTDDVRYVRFSCRGYPAAEMTTRNEVLKPRELGFETDTLKSKLGDGVTAWNSLPYLSADVGDDLADIEALSPADDDFLQRKSGAWASRTVAQVKTDLGLGTAPLTASVDSGSAVALTSGSAADVAYVDLPVGAWIVTGNVAFFPNAATDMTILRAWISDVSATQPAPPNAGAFQQLVLPFATGSGQSLSAGSAVFTVASGTTRIHLGTRCTFATNSLSAGGHLSAVRLT
jgi:hypothetical protein